MTRWVTFKAASVASLIGAMVLPFALDRGCTIAVMGKKPDISARVWASSALGPTPSTWTKVPFNTSTDPTKLTFDPTGLFVDASDWFLIKTPGTYLIGCLLGTGATGSPTQHWVSIVKNGLHGAGGAVILNEVNNYTTNTGNLRMASVGVAPLAAGDTVECDVFMDGTTITVASTANYEPLFWITYIGP